MNRWPVVALLVGAVAPSGAHATEYVNDPLTAASHAQRGGSRGGSFGADGWTTSGDTDTVWYEIPDALESGSVEYTVKGLSLSTNLTGADHDILVLYQAPDGLAEPISYLPGFRNNDFKAFTRIFGAQETGRPGAMKLELAACPRGSPWYHDTACEASCSKDGIAYGSGGNSLGWDAATEYRMKVTWSPGTMSFSRNGTVLGTVHYDGTYAPQPLRIRLGSPRHGGSVNFMPPGLVFKDVLITGTAGARTPVCGAPPAGADAGTAIPPDAGAPLPSDTLAALQDVTGASWESGVYPDVNDLNPEGNGSSATAVAFLKFPPVGGAVSRAELRLRTQAISSAAGGSGKVCRVDSDAWTETTLTWANKPAWGACLGPERSVDSDQEVAWDVTALVHGGGNVNLAVVSTDTNGVHYESKESGGTTKGPRLVFQLAPPGADASVAPPGPDAAHPGPDAAAPPAGADAAGPGADAGAPAASDGGAPRPDAGTKPPETAEGGCGCSTSSGGALGLLALAGLAARRRRRP